MRILGKCTIAIISVAIVITIWRFLAIILFSFRLYAKAPTLTILVKSVTLYICNTFEYTFLYLQVIFCKTSIT